MVVQLAANVLVLACGWVLFLALLLVAAIVLTYYEVGIVRRRPGSP